MYSDIFRVCDHSLLPKRRSLRSDGLQADWTHSCHCCESAAALFLSFCLVEVRDALFGYDVTDVIAVDHDGGDWHSSLLANLHSVESLNERRNATLLKSLYGLYHELSTANDRLVLRNQVKPRWSAVPPAMRVVSHIWRAAEARETPSCHCRRVCVGIHLQRGTDKSIDRILSRELTQNPVRTEAAISSRKENIRACRDILIHSNFAAETVNAFDPATFDCGNHCRVWIERPVFTDLSAQSKRLPIGRQKKFNGRSIEANSVIQGVNPMPFIYAPDH